MSCIALVVLLYLGLRVARAGKAGSYFAAPELGWRASLFVFVAVPALPARARSLEAGAS